MIHVQPGDQLGVDKAHSHEPPVPPRQWHTVAADLVSMPATINGFIYALTIIDTFSRVAAVVPLKSKHARTVGRKLKAVFEAKWLGPPVTLLTDNGKEFTAGIIKKLCASYGVQQKFTTAYNPKANGTIERYNQTLICNIQLDVLSALTEASIFPKRENF